MLQQTSISPKEHKTSSKSNVDYWCYKTENFIKEHLLHRLFKIAHREGQVFDSITETAGYLFFLKNLREHFVNICPELSCSCQAPLSCDEEMRDCCS